MDLDDDLRRLFADERLEVSARPGAEDVIVAGARRVRRRRIAAVTATGALAVVAMAAAGILLAGGNPDAMPPANRYKNTPSSTTTTTTTSPSQPSTMRTVSTGTVQGNDQPPATNEPENTETSTPLPDLPPRLNLPVLGPSGFSALQLGQTQEEAEATGMVGVSTSEQYGNCSEYQLLVDTVHVGWVYFSSSGVAAIMPFEAQTPEGVGLGWTVEQAAAVYPDFDMSFARTNGYAVVSAPGDQGATFRLLVDTNMNQVTRVTLQTAAQPCFS